MSNVTTLTNEEYQFLVKDHSDQINQLQLIIAEEQGENIKLKETIQILENALHRDKTGLCKAIDDIRKIAEGYSWIAEGRGPFAYNDDNYFKEAGYMLDAIKDRVSKAMTESGWSHAYCCTRFPTYEELMKLLEFEVKRNWRYKNAHTIESDLDLHVETAWQVYRQENKI